MLAHLSFAAQLCNNDTVVFCLQLVVLEKGDIIIDGGNSEYHDTIVSLPIIEPAHKIMVLITSATSKGSGEPVHPLSLTRAFAVCTHEVLK